MNDWLKDESRRVGSSRVDVMDKNKVPHKGKATLPSSRRSEGQTSEDTEVRATGVGLSRLEPFDVAFHAALSNTLEEWATQADDEAFRDLLLVGSRDANAERKNYLPA